MHYKAKINILVRGHEETYFNKEGDNGKRNEANVLLVCNDKFVVACIVYHGDLKRVEFRPVQTRRQEDVRKERIAPHHAHLEIDNHLYSPTYQERGSCRQWAV